MPLHAMPEDIKKYKDTYKMDGKDAQNATNG
jgi:hypothetical protein